MTSPMTKEELAKPDNAADKTIQLAISGNRLVSVLNALDAALFAAGRYRFEGNACVAEYPAYAELRNVTESIRDELSRQRCAQSEQNRVSEMETALCLWEAMLDERHKIPALDKEWLDHGTCAMRSSVVNMVADCEAQWNALTDDERDVAVFDWEFCPAFIAKRFGS